VLEFEWELDKGLSGVLGLGLLLLVDVRLLPSAPRDVFFEQTILTSSEVKPFQTIFTFSCKSILTLTTFTPFWSDVNFRMALIVSPAAHAL
jgi:hypothetical protein